MKRRLLVYLTFFVLALAVTAEAEYRLVGSSFCGGCLLHCGSSVALSASFQFYERQNSSKSTRTGLAEINNAPLDYKLLQNYPNPFNPSTTIEFTLPVRCHARLKVYSLLGDEIAVLVDEPLPAGNYKKSWNAATLANGAYYFVLETPAFRQSRVAILLK